MFVGVSSMFVKLIKDMIRPICSFFVFLKYKNILNLKKYLKQNNKQSGMSASVYNAYLLKRGSYIGINAVFENDPYFPHGILGIFISDLTKIGKNAVIFQHVTIGADRLIDSKDEGNPIIGDNVYIGAGAKIIGNIKIGNNCRIGANAVVYKDMPDNSVAVCAETRIIQKEKDLDNRFIIAREDGTKEYYKDGKFIKLDSK